MNKKHVRIASIGIGIAITAIIYIVCINFWIMGVDETEINIATTLEGQNNAVETALDNMINTIVNQHNVNKEFAEKFIVVAEEQSNSRKGGSLFKSTTEAANKLGIPETTYLKIMNTIQGEFDEFKSSQDLLTSKWEEHKKWVLTPYHNNPWYAFGMGPSLKSKLKDKPKMISSENVKGAMQTKTYDGTKLLNVEK